MRTDRWDRARCVVLVGLAACAQVSQPHGWAESPEVAPGWQRIKSAAKDALLSPYTWAPLAGAALLQVGDMDGRLSSWAYRKNPLYGSPDGAERFQDSMRQLSNMVYVGTLMATPSRDRSLHWGAAKVAGIALLSGTGSLSHTMVNQGKDWTKRDRPNSVGGYSFPSVYAADIAVTTTMTYGNLRSTPMPHAVRTAANAGLLLMTGLGSWARVEAGEHYPSDVLVGMALGHFMAAFVNDAFLHKNYPEPTGVALGGGPPGAIGLSVVYRY